MESEFLSVFYKGPITSCEYLNNEKILIGYGPYLSLIDESSFEELAKFMALKYRVIHKIVINPIKENNICIFGQKAFNLVSLENNNFNNLIDQYVELDDWIFDIYWMNHGKSSLLAIVLAHNNCIIYNLETKKIQKFIECDQKCMLYSAKIFDSKIFDDKENLLVASGTIYNEILIWSLEEKMILLNLKGHQGVIFNIEYSYRTNHLYSTSDDRSINVWKINLNEKSGDLYARFYGHEARVWKCKAFLKDDNEFLCSIGEDLKCCLWNVQDKKLIYKFDSMRKGSKNIWSMAVNETKLQIITGWADGSLKKFNLNLYLNQKSLTDSSDNRQESTELDLNLENEKDFIKSTVLINSRVICCTNLGYLYMIDLVNQNQKLLFKSILLSSFNTISKIYIDTNHWCLAIGTLKGFVYLLDLKFKNKNTYDPITIDCINCLGIEEEIAESNNDSTIKTNLLTQGSSKIFNIIWLRFDNRIFLLVCFSLLNGLVHLYEFKSNKQLKLISRLYLPVCKHRWFTSAAIITINAPIFDQEQTDSKNFFHEMFMIGGDKCGNLHLFKLSVILGSVYEDSEEVFCEFKLIKPIESINNVCKGNSPISAIYAQNLDHTNSEVLTYLIICCCKDGYYRVFEFKSICFAENEEETQSSQSDQSTYSKNVSMLKLINKYQINSYIDLIEDFIFDSDDRKEYALINSVDQNLSSWEKNNLELNLKLAFCFYGDKFMLWNFQLNRSLFESKCGGANRSWDLEFTKNPNDENLLFRFIFIKNKSISENRKVLFKSEIERPVSHIRNHLCQIFHGNTITINKFLLSGKYLLTGSEDTQLIVTKITKMDKCSSLIHEFHLQGHESVIKCIGFYKLNETEVLLITAGGKANIKIWKVIFDQKCESIERIISLYDFKLKLLNSFKNKSKNFKSEKPWSHVDLKSNPDIRFMDICLVNTDDDPILCFACSDGCIRIFRYSIETNKLFLINKYEYSKCLLCIRRMIIDAETYLLAFGTDGNLLFWKINFLDDQQPQIIYGLNQSGINDVDFILLPGTRQAIIATVGDDTCLSITKIEVNHEQNVKASLPIIKFEMSHASAIAGVKFILPNLIATVSKDQRLVIWKIDLDKQEKFPIKVYFLNVSDVSSMDLIKLNDDLFRFSLVGLGMEIIDFKLKTNSLKVY